MDKSKINKYINKFVKVIKKEFDPERIAIFGSFIRDDFNEEESDVDVLVVSNKFEDMDFNQRASIFHKIDAGIEVTFDIFPFTEKELKKATPFSTPGQARDTAIDIYKKVLS
jgi:predicted nucleotidyltransferase